MFSLPRDTVDVPIPPGPPARSSGRRTAAARSTASTRRPGTGPTSSRARPAPAGRRPQGGPRQPLRARHPVLRRRSTSTASRTIVDALGGVTINVQMPVVDDHYPGDNGTDPRVHPGRGPAHERRAGAHLRPLPARLERLRPRPAPAAGHPVAPRADRPATILDNLSQLLADLKKSVKTDIPQSKLPQLLAARRADRLREDPLVRVRAAVLRARRRSDDPRGYVIEPNVTRIRRAVASAFKVDPAIEAAAREGRRGERRRSGSSTAPARPGQASRHRRATSSTWGLTACAPNEAARPDDLADQDHRLQRRRDATCRRRSPCSRTCST